MGVRSDKLEMIFVCEYKLSKVIGIFHRKVRALHHYILNFLFFYFDMLRSSFIGKSPKGWKMRGSCS